MTNKMTIELQETAEKLKEYGVYFDNCLVKNRRAIFTMPDIEESYEFIEDGLKKVLPVQIIDVSDPSESLEEDYSNNIDSYITVGTQILFPSEERTIDITVGSKVGFKNFIHICNDYMEYMDSGDDSSFRLHHAEYSEIIGERIDNDIKQIVELINLLGVITLSSCQGGMTQRKTTIGEVESYILLDYNSNVEVLLDIIDSVLPLITVENILDSCGCRFQQSYDVNEIGVKYIENGDKVLLSFGENFNLKKLEKLLKISVNVYYQTIHEQQNFNSIIDENRPEADLNTDQSLNLKIVTSSGTTVLESMVNGDEDLMIINPSIMGEIIESINLKDIKDHDKFIDDIANKYKNYSGK